MSLGALDGYLSAWREADPQRTYAWLFLGRDERVRYGACAALIHEWWKILREVREPQVAMAKLGWWREELQRAGEGGAQHPLTQALFADARVREVPLPHWTAVVDAALLQVGAPTPAAFDVQRRAMAPLAMALAELETRIWFAPSAGTARAAGVTALAGIAAGLRALPSEVERGRSPLPMSLLARHGLSIEGLASPGPARRAALRDYAQLLHAALAEAAAMPGPLTLFRALALQHDLENLGRAASAQNPLDVLRAPGLGFAAWLKSWRAARTWRAVLHSEGNP